MDDGEGKAGGHGGIHGVAALAQDLEAGVGGKVVHADHHAVARADGLLAAPGQHVLLRGLGRGEDRRAGNNGGESGKEKRGNFMRSQDNGRLLELKRVRVRITSRDNCVPGALKERPKEAGCSRNRNWSTLLRQG